MHRKYKSLKIIFFSKPKQKRNPGQRHNTTQRKISTQVNNNSQKMHLVWHWCVWHTGNAGCIKSTESHHGYDPEYPKRHKWKGCVTLGLYLAMPQARWMGNTGDAVFYWMFKKGALISTSSLKQSQRWSWECLWGIGWSAYGLVRGHRYHLQVNWTELAKTFFLSQ